MEAEKRKKERLTEGEAAGFCEQIAMIFESGVPIYMGMEALKTVYEGRKNAQCFTAVCDRVIGGETLRSAFESVPGWPAYMVEMVGIGEMTGRMDLVMAKLAAHYRREDELRQAVRSAVAYPMVLSVMVIGILLVMIFKVMPVFSGVLAGMGLSMADSGMAFMRAGTVIGTAMLILMVMAVILAAVGIVLARTPLRTRVLHWVGKVFPPLGKMRKQRSATRTASVLAMLLAGGIPLREAFGLIPAVLEDEHAGEAIRQMAQAVQSGRAVGDAIAESGLFDEMSACFIRTGATVGVLDTTMEKIAQDYEQRAEKSLDHFASSIEPTLVGLLAVVIGGVLLSLMLPMGGIISGML